MLYRPLALAAATLGLAAVAFGQAVAPLPGDIVVSEIMFNPGPDVCVTDADGEYFELTNISNKAIDLNDLYFEDKNTTTGLPSGFGFHIPATAGIAPLYPGQIAVFVRHSTGNGPLPVTPTYVYASTGSAPSDKSQTGSTQMMLNNSGVDGIFIATGNFASQGGSIVEEVSYNASLTPLTFSSGISVERLDLFAPWKIDASNNNSSNISQALPGALYGVPNGTTCLQQNRGTPGSNNSQDLTSWIQANHYQSFNDSLQQNTGAFVPKAPASVGFGSLKYHLANGPASAAFSLGYAPTTFELYLDPFILPGNPGAILLDLNTAVFLNDPSFQFDASGNCDLNIPIAGNPALVGFSTALQWLSIDFTTFTVILSNGLSVTICQ